jgi:hypothetical protein
MTEHNPHHYIIDRIFEETGMQEKITLDLENTGEQSGSGPGKGIRILAVNGYKSPGEFLHGLEYTLERLEEKVAAQRSKVPPARLLPFLKELGLRFRNLRDLVVPEKRAGDPAPPGSWGKTIWKFNNPVLAPGNILSGMPGIDELLSEDLNPYAFTWYRGMENERVNISIMSLIVRFSFPPSHPGAVADREKIRLTMTVARFAALVRVEYESGLFGALSIADLCRMVCDTFTTLRDENISVKSFRNLFDTPQPKSLEFCRQYFEEARKCIDALFRRYFSN